MRLRILQTNQDIMDNPNSTKTHEFPAVTKQCWGNVFPSLSGYRLRILNKRKRMQYASNLARAWKKSEIAFNSSKQQGNHDANVYLEPFKYFWKKRCTNTVRQEVRAQHVQKHSEANMKNANKSWTRSGFLFHYYSSLLTAVWAKTPNRKHLGGPTTHDHGLLVVFNNLPTATANS